MGDKYRDVFAAHMALYLAAHKLKSFLGSLLFSLLFAVSLAVTDNVGVKAYLDYKMSVVVRSRLASEDVFHLFFGVALDISCKMVL